MHGHLNIKFKFQGDDISRDTTNYWGKQQE